MTSTNEDIKTFPDKSEEKKKNSNKKKSITSTNETEKKPDENNKKPWYRNPAYLSVIVATLAIIVAIIINIPSPDFSLSLNPMSGAVQAGGVIQTPIDVKSINGYGFTVSLSANGQPSGMVFTFGPPFGEAIPSYTSTITINVDQSVSPGIYKIGIKGTGANGKEHNCIYTLTVNPTAPSGGKGFIPTPTPTLTLTPTPTPTITPTSTPEIKFTYPKDGDKFPLATGHTVEGNASNVPNDLSLWIVTAAPDNNLYPNTPVVIFKNTWSAKIWIGQPEDVDEIFYIKAILADEKADTELQEYMDKSRREGHWLGLYSLPKGAKSYDEVKVIGIV